MVVVVFRGRAKPGIGKEYEETDARMADLAATMPGFVSYRQYVSADGEPPTPAEWHPGSCEMRRQPQAERPAGRRK